MDLLDLPKEVMIFKDIDFSASGRSLEEQRGAEWSMHCPKSVPQSRLCSLITMAFIPNISPLNYFNTILMTEA